MEGDAGAELRVEREQALIDVLTVGVGQRDPRHARLFAAVFEKASFAGEDIAQIAFEQLSSRFDQYLGRLHQEGDTQRGLILFDKCSTEQRIQTLAKELKYSGHSGQLAITQRSQYSSILKRRGLFN